MSGQRDSTPNVTRITALSSRKEKVKFHYITSKTGLTGFADWADS